MIRGREIAVGSMECRAQESQRIIGVLEGVFANETMEGFQFIVMKGQVYVHGNWWVR